KCPGTWRGAEAWVRCCRRSIPRHTIRLVALHADATGLRSDQPSQSKTGGLIRHPVDAERSPPAPQRGFFGEGRPAVTKARTPAAWFLANALPLKALVELP